MKARPDWPTADSAERLLFRRPEGGRLQIGSVALEAILRHLQHATDAPEAGGVLLGRYILGTRDVVVDAVTGPMREDRRSRTRFYRHRRGHQVAIECAWEESGGTCAWLGEWHTHPEPMPTPSWVDRADWRRKLLVDRYDEALFFVIAGTTTIRAWEGRWSTRIRPLSPEPARPDVSHIDL
jgi:integrative and conjugative element protein (TIGR02256 family)